MVGCAGFTVWAGLVGWAGLAAERRWRDETKTRLWSWWWGQAATASAIRRQR